MRYNARTDHNQPKIVKALKRVGAVVVYTHELPNAFDILVGFRGKLFAMEIKNIDKLPKKFFNMSETDKEKYLVDMMLTEGEQECRRKFNAVGVDYHIPYSIDQALEIIGAKTPFFKMKKQR